MKHLKLFFVIILVINFSLVFTGQQNPVDSLKAVIETTKIDTVKVNALNEIANVLRGRNNEQALQYAEQALVLSKKINYNKGTAEVYKTLGIINFMFGEFEKALEATNNARSSFEEINDKKGIAACYVNIGIFKRNTGEIKESIDNFQKALGFYEEINDKEGIAKTYLNLGNIYRQQGNFKNSIDYYFKSLKFYEEINDRYNAAQLYQNIGIVYDEQNESEKASENFNKALEIFNAIQDVKGIAEVNNNLGNFYADKDNFQLAGEYYLKSLELFEEMGYTPMVARLYYNLGDVNNKEKKYGTAKDYFNKSIELYSTMNYLPGLALCYNGLGEYYYFKHDYIKAIEYLLKAKKIAKETDINISIEAVEWLSLNYAKLGDYKNAYENHVEFKKLNDSIFNENNEKEVTELRMQYQFEQEEKIRKEKEKIEAEKNAVIQKEKDKRNFLVKLGLSLLVLFMLIIAIISVHNYRRKVKANILLKSQKEEIEFQKVELEQSNEEILAQRDEIENQNIMITEQRDIALKQKQEITDSIQYAQRIQEAVLPDKKIFDNLIDEYFIYFKPKDIVSGDFYWMNKIEDKLIVTAADCTGHGVPGAFMSLLGVTFLNEIVNTDKILNAGKILDKLRTKVMDSLHQKDRETKDGMDMAIAIIDTAKQEIQFAGAYNPLYMISKNNSNEIHKIPADRMPIGIYLRMDKEFTNHVIPYEKGDIIYMFSDGYMDQFGGEHGRKLKSSKFQELLYSIHEKPMAQQQETLDQFINKWRGDIEQLDDIIVIGIKL